MKEKGRRLTGRLQVKAAVEFYETDGHCETS